MLEESEALPFPILDFALDLLREDPKGVERYEWCEHASEALRVLLDAVFDLPEQPAPLILELLRLASALKVELESPSAAASLVLVLGDDPRVMRVVDHHQSNEVLAQRAIWLGSEGVKRAPMYEGRAAKVPAPAPMEMRTSHRRGYLVG